jgi:hypothetical protein
MVKSFIIAINAFMLALCPLMAGEIDHHYYAKWKNGPPADSTFFPIMVWWQPVSLASQYKTCGINIYQAPDFSSGELDSLKSIGLYAACGQSQALLSDPNRDIIIEWLHQDEPDLAQEISPDVYGPCISPESTMSLYRKWKAADPTRPVEIGLSQGVSFTSYKGRGACSGRTDMYPEYCKSADIIGFDIYPVTSRDTAVAGNLWYMPKGVDSLYRWSNYEKPVYTCIECTHINSRVLPTPAQIRTEVWMALIHGAKGILYFCHEWQPSFAEAAWLTRYPEIKSAITVINHQIIDLAPVLNSPTIYDKATVSINQPAQVDIMVKVHDGYTYLFAVAMKNRGDLATYTLHGLPVLATAEVLGENRSLTIANGQFDDSMAAYGLHLYKINAPIRKNQ